MHIQKRSVAAEICADIIKHPTEPIEQKTHKCWRRFMNQRVRDRAYIPTAHGRFQIFSFFYLSNTCFFFYQEHAANCITHGVLIIPAFIAAQRLVFRAETLAQYWSSIIYGNALILLFSFSTLFHCSCFHPTYRYGFV